MKQLKRRLVTSASQPPELTAASQQQEPKSAKPPKPTAKPLIQPRKTTAEQLSISVWRVIELERKGKLKSIRLADSPLGRSYNLCSEVEALVLGGTVQP
jgi:hypothetical protein